MARGFTGRHMAACMVAFFGIVIGVNMVMATAASRSFGGTVVENSYVASQRFNGWLRDAQAQKDAGWRAALSVRGERVEAVVTQRGRPADEATVTAVASHPLGRRADIRLTFRDEGGGRYVSRESLPAGRWRVALEIVGRGVHAGFVQDVWT